MYWRAQPAAGSWQNEAKRGRDKQQSSSLPGVQLSRVSQVKMHWQLLKTDSKQLLLSLLNQVALSFPSFDFPKNKYNMRWSYLLEKIAHCWKRHTVLRIQMLPKHYRQM